MTALAQSSRLYRLPKLREVTALSTTTIYRLIREGRFPRPIRVLGTHVSAWLASEVDDWLKCQVAARDSSASTPQRGRTRATAESEPVVEADQPTPARNRRRARTAA